MLVAHARAMRREATSAERVLWRALRDRQLGTRVRRQVPLGPFIADFYLPAFRLVIEVDGETHAAASADVSRDAWFAGNGVRVLRFTNREVLKNLEGVVAAIAAELPGPPPPRPSPARGEGERA